MALVGTRIRGECRVSRAISPAPLMHQQAPLTRSAGRSRRAHVLTPDNFRLSPGKKDFTAPQGLRTSLPRSSSAVTCCCSESRRSYAILVRSNLLLFGIATIVAVLSLKDAGVPSFLIE